MLNSMTPSQSKRNGSESSILAWIGPKPHQKYVLMGLLHTTRCFPTSSRRTSVGKPSNARYRGAALLLVRMKSITLATDQTRRGCLQDPSSCSSTSCSLLYPKLCFPHKETRSDGCSFPISTPRLARWKERDTIQHIRGHVENANHFCMHGWTCSKPHETSPQTVLPLQACSN